MPRIPQSDFPTIQTGVSRAAQTRTGGSQALAGAIGGLGSEIADLGARMKNEHEESVAKTWAHKNHRTNKLKYAENARLLREDMDPETGQIDGRPAEEVYQENMEAWQEDTINSAPNKRASEYYKNLSRMGVTQSIIGMNGAVFKQTAANRRRASAEDAEIDGKMVLDLDGSGSAARAMVGSLIETKENQLESEKNNLVGAEESEAMRKAYNNDQVMSLVKNRFLKDDLDTVEEMVKSSSPEAKHLTLDQKAKILRELDAKRDAKLRVSSADLNKEIDNYVAGAVSTEPSEQIRISDEGGHSQYIGLADRIMSDPKKTPARKTEDINRVTLSLVVGESYDRMREMSPSEFKSYVQGTRGRMRGLKELLLKSGASPGDLTSKKAIMRAMEMQQRAYDRHGNKLRKQGVSYVVTYDLKAEDLHKRLLAGESNALGPLMEYTEEKLVKAGIAPHERILIPKEYAESVAAEFEGLQEPNTVVGYQKAAQFIQQKKLEWGKDNYFEMMKALEKAGMDKQYVYALQYPPTPEGMKLQAKVFENTYNRPVLLEKAKKAERGWFESDKFSEKEFSLAVAAETNDLIEGTVAHMNLADADKNATALNHMVENETLRLMGTGMSQGKAIKQAYETMLGSHYTMIEAGDSKITISNDSMEKYGFDENDVERKVGSLEDMSFLKEHERLDSSIFPQDIQDYLNESKLSGEMDRGAQVEQLLLDGAIPGVGKLFVAQENGKLVLMAEFDGRPVRLRKVDILGQTSFAGIDFKDLSED